MGALTSLNISENYLFAEGAKLLAEALKINQIMTALLNISTSSVTYNGKKYGDMSGVAALAGVIPGMGALTSLNLSSNFLKAKGAEIVAEAMKVPNCAIADVLVPLSCPSIWPF
jgi:hypothetical protein